MNYFSVTLRHATILAFFLQTCSSSVWAQRAGTNSADRTSASPHSVLESSQASSTTSQNSNNPPANAPGSGASKDLKFKPATFIYIYEDTPGGRRIKVYDPTKPQDQTGIQLSADFESTLVIIPDPDLMGNDLPLNNLYMSAALSSEDKNQNVEVKGYSEVGTDKAAMTSQRGMAFQTTRNVTNMIINMAYTAFDIMRDVSSLDPNKPLYEQEDQIKGAIDELRKTTSANGDAIQRAKDRLALYKPEIQAISAFFTDPQNISVVQILGKEIFWIDDASLREIAKQYQDNIRIAFDSNSTPDAQKQAVVQLIERTNLVVEDFRELISRMDAEAQSSECQAEIEQKYHGRITSAKTKTSLLHECGVERVADDRRRHAFDALKKLFAPGTISLRSAKAADGNLLTITVTAVGSEGSTTGIPGVFEVSLKKYGAKIQWSPSLLFVRRLRVTDAEVTPPAGSTVAPLNRINFAPSPGMTFGIAYFKRGRTGGDKFLRTLGPGVGMNVTFMNFNDPSFDLTTGKFVNTTGTNVQVGAGVIGSLFDNKIQFSYGWNLNVERRRNYFGVGFGFIEIGKELTKYVGK